jgi:hypothetical protein
LLFLLSLIEVVPFENILSCEEYKLFAVLIVKLKLDAGICELEISQLLKLKFSLGILLVDCDFSDLELVFDDELTKSNSDLLFIL